VRGAAVITGAAATAGVATVAMTGAVEVGAEIAESGRLSLGATTESAGSGAPVEPAEERGVWTVEAGSGVLADGSGFLAGWVLWPTGGVAVGAPVLAGDSESPRRCRGASTVAREPPPRAVGASGASASASAGTSAGESSSEAASDPDPVTELSGAPLAPAPPPLVPAPLPVSAPLLEPLGASVADDSPPRRGLARPSARDDELADDPAEESAFDPDDPPEPVLSANATGSAPAADPTPRAIASAPIRPI
jgi:hypothetical protein